jgi:hypothetical protein
MNKIERLLNSYRKYIEIPWREDVHPKQRVIFCVYNEAEERSIRARVDEFELLTKETGHNWSLVDITNSFPEWLSAQRYAHKYFEKPDDLQTLLHRYEDYIVDVFNKHIDVHQVGANHVIALLGVGTLFGFLKVRDLVEKIENRIHGRLLVFFPGSYENNNYRLLDGYDGWNYLAVPITADKD